LTPPPNESEVPTSIVFARLIDFIRYMADDPFDLLFARNVRLWLGNTETNQEIQKTFKKCPQRICLQQTMGSPFCARDIRHNLGKQELLLENPRVVKRIHKRCTASGKWNNPSPNGTGDGQDHRGAGE